MKTRVTPLAVAISSLSLLMTACGGSGPGSFTSTPTPTPTPTPAPPPASAPTVTVTAPSAATSGEKFTVAWTSTDATSCAADFTSKTTTSGSVSKTVAVPATAPVTETYNVTCTGAGGTGTGSASVVVTPNATAQGAWQGLLTTSGRAIAGVVTDQGNYWLAYTEVSDHSKPAGFYAGVGTSQNGNYSSSNLREFNFESGGAKQGTETGTYTQSLGYTSNNALHGTINANAGQTITAYTNTPFAAAGGSLIMDFTGTYDATATMNSAVLGRDVTGVATMTGDVYIPGFSTSIHYNTMNFVMDPATGLGATIAPDATSANCTDNTGSGCPGFSGALVFPLYNAINFQTTTNKNGTFDASSGTPFTPAAGSYTWTGIANVPVNGKNTIAQLPLTITLAGSPLPVVTADTFDATYDSSYEETPSLATVDGTYTASAQTPVYAGIGSLMNTDTSNTTALSITAGTITGTEATTGCGYSGTIAPHSAGNVYDVTTLTFNGGSCPVAYTGGGITFTGVATFNATTHTLTLTAVANDADRDLGFMVVATHD